jgi:hypothetical protein
MPQRCLVYRNGARPRFGVGCRLAHFEARFPIPRKTLEPLIKRSGAFDWKCCQSGKCFSQNQNHRSSNGRANLDYDAIKDFKVNGLRLFLVGYERGNDETLTRIGRVTSFSNHWRSGEPAWRLGRRRCRLHLFGGIVKLLLTKNISAALITCCALFSWSAEHAKPSPDLMHSRSEVSPTVNAATEWKEAEAVFIPIAEECKEDILVAWSLQGERLDPSQIERLSNWIQSNGTALGLIEKSLQKDRAQIPAWDSLKPMPYGVALINLAKARLFLADQAAAKGDHATATRLFLGNLKLSRLLRDAEVPVIHYLIACSMRSLTEKAIVRWAMFANLDSKTIQAMLSELPELADEATAYERILRVEFTDFILPSVDVKRLAQLWVEAARTNGRTPAPIAGGP